MKKILMGAVVLLTFALALTLTQVSCSKAGAQTTGTTGTPNPVGLILYEGDNHTANTVTFYVCNYDGSNAHQIPVPSLPSGFVMQEGARLSPDGKTLFFVAGNPAIPNPVDGGTYQCYVYSVGVDGSNLKQVTAIPLGTSYDAMIEGAY